MGAVEEGLGRVPGLCELRRARFGRAWGRFVGVGWWGRGAGRAGCAGAGLVVGGTRGGRLWLLLDGTAAVGRAELCELAGGELGVGGAGVAPGAAEWGRGRNAGVR